MLASDARRGRRGHHSFSRRMGGTAIVGVIALIAGLITAPPAMAATATATLSQETGTAPFNAAAGAGYDISATDEIVRTNDFVTYVLSVGVDTDTMTAPAVTMTFPQGQEMSAVPAFCKAGSSLTPAVIPPPNPATLTGTTYQSLPAQTLVCNLADIAPGAAVGVRFTTRVRPEMPNGAVMGPVSATISNTNPAVPAVTTGTVKQTVSAAAKWDVSVNGAAGAVNTAFVKQATVQRCTVPSIPRNPDGSNQMCYVGGYPVTVSITDGGRGGAPMLGGNFTFAMNVDPVTIWGPAAAGLDPALWGGHLGIRQDSPYESPNSYLSQGTALNSVRNSGTISTTQPGGPGTPIIIKVTGADTTAYTVPTDAGSPANFKVRTDRGYVWTQRIFVEIPMTALMNQGDTSPFDINPAPGVTQAKVSVVTNESSLTGWSSVPGLSGSGDTNLWSNPAGQGNNYRQGTATLRDYVPATVAWVSPVNYATDTAPIIYSPGFPAWDGPSGPTGKDTGDGVAVEGQTVLSMTHLNGDTLNGVTTLICQTFDNTQVRLAPGSYPGNGAAQQPISSSQYPPYTDADTGGTTWISGSMVNFNSPTALTLPNDTRQDSMTSRFGDFRVEYGVGPAGDTGCTGAITWSSTPSAAANHVRVFIQNKPGVNALLQRTSITTAFTVLDNPVGTLIPTNVSYTQAAGAQTFEYMTDPARTWIPSNYSASTNLDDRPTIEGRSGDRLTMVDIMGRVSKTVQTSPTDTKQVSTDTWVPSTQLWAQEVATLPVYGPGSTFAYTLNPTLTANPMPPAGTLRDVLIEDCLPVSVVFASASLNPNYSGSDRTPYTKQITCKPGEFYLAWFWPKRDVTQQLSPITVNVRVLETAPTGERINNVLMTTESDLSSLDQRRDYARITIQSPDGIRVAKAALTPIIYVDQNGWVSSPTVEWRIVARNLNAGLRVDNVDIIDWLPNSGDNGSSFTGDGAFIQAFVSDKTGDIAPEILYTKAGLTGTVASWSDPANPIHDRTSGSVVWCTAPTGGTVKFGPGVGSTTGCPQSPAEVTGLRVWAPGEFADGESLTVRVIANARGNLNGDVMNNLTVMRVDGIDVPVSSSDRTVFDQRNVPPNLGSISGIVWKDVNSDGERQAGDDPVPGTVVTLKDPSGAIVAQMTTPADGGYFFEVLAGVAYTLEFTPPTGSGLVPTKMGVVGADTQADSIIDASGKATVPAVTSQADQYRTGFDAGFRLPGTLALTKSVTGMTGQSDTGRVVPARVGDVLTYTVEVQNTSTTDWFTADYPAFVADDLSDLLKLGTIDPASVTVTPATGAGTASISGSTLTWSGPLAPQAKATITYQLTVTQVDDGTATNTAYVTPSADPGTPPANCVAPTCVQTNTPVVPRVARPSLTKTVTGGTGPNGEGVVGDTLTYTVTLTNVGDADFTTTNPAALVDDLTNVLDNGTLVGTPTSTVGPAPTYDATTKRLSWSGPLAQTTSVTVTYQVTLTTAGTDRQALNLAYVPTDLANPTPPAVCAAPTCVSVPTTVLAPRPELTKTVTGATGPDGKAVVGDTLTYSVTFTNTGDGPYTAANPGTFADDLTAVLDGADFVTGSITSTGAAATFDAAAKRLTWSGSLAANGGSVTVTYQVRLTSLGGGLATNTVYAVADPANPVPPTVCAAPSCVTTSTQVTAPGALVEKSVAGTTGANGAATVGDELTYTVALTNTGDGPYAKVSLVDDLTQVLDNGTLVAGSISIAGGANNAAVVGNRIEWTGPLAAGATVTLTYKIAVTAIANDPITNVAFGAAGDPGPTPAVCATPACDTTTTAVVRAPVPQASVQKTVTGATGAGKALVGDTLSYTVTMTNIGTGPFASTSLIDDVSDALDVGTIGAITASVGAATGPDADGRIVWTGPLGVGETVTLTYAVTVTQTGDNDARNIAFQSASSTATTPATCADATCAATNTPVDVPPAPAPQVTKSLTGTNAGGQAVVGGFITYTVKLKNIGDADYTAVEPATLTDDLTKVLDNGTFVAGSLTASTGTASLQGGNKIVWTGPLAVDAEVTLTYRIQVTAIANDPMTNVAFATMGDPGTTPPATPTTCAAPACVTTDTPVIREPLPLATVDKTVTGGTGTGGAAVVGDTLTYTVAMKNIGTADFTNATLLDDVSGLVDVGTVGPVSVTPTGAGAVSRNGNRLVWQGPLAIGATVTLTYSVPVTNVGDGHATNLAFEADNPDVQIPTACTQADCDATDTLVGPAPTPAALVEKSVTGGTTAGSAVAGDTLSYTVKLTNVGQGAFTAANPATLVDDLRDVLDVGTLVGVVTATSGTTTSPVTVTDGRAIWSGPLAKGAFVTLTYQVKLTDPLDAAGDKDAHNVAFATTGTPGTTPPATPTDCAAPACAATTTEVTPAPAPAGRVAKKVTGATGAGGVAIVGDTLSYEVTLTNTGTAPYTDALPATLIDDLSDVLDAGTLVAGSISATTGAAPTVSGSRLVWSGPLAVGASVTVKYQVLLTSRGTPGATDDQQGARNIAFVTPTGTNGSTPTPSTCPAPTCAAVNTPVVGLPTSPKALVTKAVTGSTATTGVHVGDSLTYTVTLKNTGDAAYTDANPATLVDDLLDVIDVADLVGAPTADKGTAPTVAHNRIVWSGALGINETVTVTYTVKVKTINDGDANNYAYATGEPIDPATGIPTNPETGEMTTPPAPCAAPTCASTSTLVTEAVTPPAPAPDVTKSVSGGTGPDGAARPGDTLSYEVLTVNRGGAWTAENPLVVIDDLTDVLDNAELVAGSAYARVSGAVVNPPVLSTDGTKLTWTGPVGVGQQMLLRYQVKVKDELGDAAATNIAFATTGPIDDPANPAVPTPAPEACVAPTCATTTTDIVPLPEPLASLAKTVSISSGATSAVVGDTLTYTVTVSNVGEADFTAAAPATVVDDLARVLDHGDLVAGSVNAAAGTATVTDGRLTWTGPVAVGQSVTITYQVKVATVADGSAINLAYVPVNPANPVPPATCPVDMTGLARTAGAGAARMMAVAAVAVDCVTTTTTVGQTPVTPEPPVVTPPVTPTPTPTPTQPPLAFTGVEIGLLALLALGLIGGGLVLLVVRRRSGYVGRH